MNEQLAQFHINTNWRYHVHRCVTNKMTTLEYCTGDAGYAKALDEWLEFMKEEERFVFYVHFVSESLSNARQSLQLLIERQATDVLVRMPLLRDSFTCYSRPFKKSFGRLGIQYCIEADIGTPDPKEMHHKIINDRDQRFAHCDLSVRNPRVSKVGISLKGAGYYWDDYARLLPSVNDVINSAIGLVEAYIEEQGMKDMRSFFAQFNSSSALTEQEPELLNGLYGTSVLKPR